MGTSGTPVSKVAAKLAAVGIEGKNSSLLQDCFKQFGIQVVSVAADATGVLARRKFEGCVLPLYAPNAEDILRAARGSASNRPMVIYGIARNTQEALRFSSYGLNAVFDEPLERQSVLRVVRATHLLVIHELRRYVRIPVVTEADVDVGGDKSLTAVTVEVSAGGMSVRCPAQVPPQGMARISFTLPDAKQVKVRAQLCWSRPNEHLYGFRFDASDPARTDVRSWIDRYLELV